MTDFLRILTRKNSLRKHCQELSIDDLEKIMSDLVDILEEHKLEHSAKKEAEKKKTEKIELIRQAMADSGIDFEDLKDLVITTPKKKVQAKYRVVVDGIVHDWSGRGRTPVIFQQYFDANNTTKESCLIK